VLEKLFKNIYWMILLYYGFNMAMEYEINIEQIEQLEQQLEVTERNIRNANRERRQLVDFQKDIEEARNRVELVAQEVENIQRQLPSTIVDTENLGIIREAAETLNIKNITLSPRREIPQGFYFTKEYEFTAQGTFLQLLIFFERIGDSQRILNINSIEITRSQTEQRGRFQLVDLRATIEAYRYNQDHREERGFENTDKTDTAGQEQEAANTIPRGNIRRRNQ
jgi:Tfp pilus assembly protein PilO